MKPSKLSPFDLFNSHCERQLTETDIWLERPVIVGDKNISVNLV